MSFRSLSRKKGVRGRRIIRAGVPPSCIIISRRIFSNRSPRFINLSQLKLTALLKYFCQMGHFSYYKTSILFFNYNSETIAFFTRTFQVKISLLFVLRIPPRTSRFVLRTKNVREFVCHRPRSRKFSAKRRR